MLIRVLLVDDSRVVQETVSHYLSEWACEVLLAATLHEARLTLADSPVDLIILPRMVTDGSGLAFISELRQSIWTSDIPIIFTTSRGHKQAVADALKAGATDFLLKPFVPEELQAAMTAITADLGQP